MQGIWRDIRHVSRGLRKDSGFVLIVVLTLSSGLAPTPRFSR
jgi:hypothetical protein